MGGGGEADSCVDCQMGWVTALVVCVSVCASVCACACIYMCMCVDV